MFGIRNFTIFTGKKRMLKLAFEIVEREFANKVDKNDVPYIFHIYSVYELVKSKTDDEEVLIIALFHDLFEEFPISWYKEKLISLGFSQRVADGVDLLSRKITVTYMQYIYSLCVDKDLILVKKCDLKHNMDITRFRHFRNEEFSLMKRYHKAYKKLEFFEENGLFEFD